MMAVSRKIEIPLLSRGNEEVIELDLDNLPEPHELVQVLQQERTPLKIWIDLAFEYYRQGKSDALELLLERCQQIFSHVTDDRQALGRVYDILAVHFTRKGREIKNRDKRRELFGKAAALLTQADKILVYEANHLLARAYHCFIEGKIEQAEQQFSFVIQSNDTSIPALLGRACIEFNRKESSGDGKRAALSSYRKALRLNPNCPADVRLGIGHCFYRLHQIGRAEHAFERALAVDPKCVGALVGLACIELNKRTHESIRRGVMMLERAYRIDPKDPMVLILLSDHYFRSKNIKGTLVLARRAFDNTEDESMQAESCFQLARAYHYSQDYNNAFEFYYKATQFASPQFVLPQYGLGQMYIQRGELENATQCFEAVLKVYPNNYESMKILGSLYSRSITTTIGSNSATLATVNKKEQAKAFFKKITEQKSKDYESWIELASLLEQSDSKSALNAYITAISLYDESKLKDEKTEDVAPEIYNNIAALYFNENNLEEAQKYYQLALEKCKNHQQQQNEENEIIYTIKYNLARLYEAQHNLSQAEKIYKEILKQHPNYVDCYLRLGCMERDRGQIFEASDRFKEALRVEQDHPDAWSLIGNLHLAKFEWGPGQKKFERIIEKNKENPDVYSLIAVGNIWLQNLYQISRDKEKVKKHRDRALQFYKAALRHDPKNIWAACGIGCVLANKGLLNEARDVFSQVREATADFPDVWINIAHIYVEQRQYVAAVAMYENCLKKFYLHANTDIMLYIARAYYKGGKLQECKNVLLRARRISPTDVVILYNLSMVLRRLAGQILFNPKSTLRQVLTAVDELHISHGYFVYLEKLNDRSKLDISATKSEIRACLDLLKQATYHVTKAKQADEEEREARRKALEEKAALEAIKAQEDREREEQERKKREELELKRKEQLKKQEETKIKILEEPAEDHGKSRGRKSNANSGHKSRGRTGDRGDDKFINDGDSYSSDSDSSPRAGTRKSEGSKSDSENESDSGNENGDKKNGESRHDDNDADGEKSMLKERRDRKEERGKKRRRSEKHSNKSKAKRGRRSSGGKNRVSERRTKKPKLSSESSSKPGKKSRFISKEILSSSSDSDSGSESDSGEERARARAKAQQSDSEVERSSDSSKSESDSPRRSSKTPSKIPSESDDEPTKSKSEDESRSASSSPPPPVRRNTLPSDDSDY